MLRRKVSINLLVVKHFNYKIVIIKRDFKSDFIKSILIEFESESSPKVTHKDQHFSNLTNWKEFNRSILLFFLKEPFPQKKKKKETNSQKSKNLIEPEPLPAPLMFSKPEDRASARIFPPLFRCNIVSSEGGSLELSILVERSTRDRLLDEQEGRGCNRCQNRRRFLLPSDRY